MKARIEWSQVNPLCGVVLALAFVSNPAGASDPGSTVREARRLLERAALAYRAPAALKDTLTYELRVPGAEPETRRLDYALGAPGEAFVDVGFLRATALDGRMYITRDDAPERYVVGPLQGSYDETLQSLAGDLAALPEPVAISMREGRGVEAYLDALRFRLLHTLEIMDLRRVAGADGSVLAEIALQADNGECLVRIDPASGFLREIAVTVRPDGAPEGFEIHADGRFDPRILKESNGLVRFDAAGRQAVSSMADLGSERFALGQLVPDFTLGSLGGDAVHLEELRGSVVVLDFWATWCVPCWQTLRDSQALSDWAGETNRRVTVLAINSLETGPSFEDKRARVAEFWTSQELGLDPLLDLDDAVFASLGSPGLPSLLIVAPDGSLARYVAGTVPDPVATLESEISALLEAHRQGSGPSGGSVATDLSPLKEMK
jgi:thiol-disulfide isomerase/thioredoxin